MTDFLGVDPERLAGLRLRCSMVSDGLRSLRLDDPVADDARRQIVIASRAVADVERRCRAVLAMDAGSTYRPVQLDPHGLLAGVLMAPAGTVIVRDPLTDPGGDGRALATAVGRWLAGHDVVATGDELAWLTDRLDRWLERPTTRSALLRELDETALARLLVATRRELDDGDAAQLDRAGRAALAGTPPPPPRTDRAALARLVDQIATLLGATAGRGRGTALLTSLPPRVAADLLPHLGLEGADLADAAAAVLRRWGARTEPRWWVDSARTPRSVADLVLAAVAGDDVAAGALIDQLDDRWDLLVFAPNDADAPARLLRQATDLALGDRARQRAQALLAWFRDDPLFATADLELMTAGLWSPPPHLDSPPARLAQVRGWIGDLVAPWLPELATAPPGPGSGAGVLAWVAEDPRAAAAMATGLGPALRRVLEELPAGPPERRAVLDALARTVGMVAELLRDAAVDEAAQRRVLWEVATAGLHLAVSRAVSVVTAELPPPVPSLAGAGSSAAIDAVLDGGADAEEPAARAELALRLASAHVLVAGVDRAARARGDLAASAPRPPPLDLADPDALIDPETLVPLEDWIEQLDASAGVRLELQHALLGVVGPADQGDLEAWLASR